MPVTKDQLTIEIVVDGKGVIKGFKDASGQLNKFKRVLEDSAKPLTKMANALEKNHKVSGDLIAKNLSLELKARNIGATAQTQIKNRLIFQKKIVDLKKAELARAGQLNSEVLKGLIKQKKILEDIASKEVNLVNTKGLKKTSGIVRKIASGMGKLGVAVIALNQGFELLERTLRTIKRGFDITVQLAANFETSLVGVSKTTSLSGKALASFGSDIKELSTQIPATNQSLLKIGEIAGQLGVDGADNLLNFADTMARVQVSTNLTAEQAATDFTKILNVTGTPIDKIDEFASVVVKLGNNFATSESKITRMTNEVARATTAFDVSAQDAAAFATAMSAMGIRAEIGGSVIARAMVRIEQAILSGGEEFENLQIIMGQTGDQIRQTFEKDATKSTRQFISALSKLKDGGVSVIDALDKVGLKGDEVNKVIPPLVKNVEDLNKAFGMARQEFVDNNALMTESNKQFATLNSEIQKTKNIFENLGIAIGDQVAPAFREFLQWLQKVGGQLSRLVRTVTFFADITANVFDQMVARTKQSFQELFAETLGLFTRLARTVNLDSLANSLFARLKTVRSTIMKTSLEVDDLKKAFMKLVFPTTGFEKMAKDASKTEKTTRKIVKNLSGIGRTVNDAFERIMLRLNVDVAFGSLDGFVDALTQVFVLFDQMTFGAFTWASKAVFNAITKGFEAAVEFLDPVIEALTDALDSSIDFLASVFSDAIENMVDLFENIGDFLSPAFEALGDLFGGGEDSDIEKDTSAVLGAPPPVAPAPAMAGAAAGMAGAAAGAVAGGMGMISGILDAIQAMIDFIPQMLDKVAGIFNSLTDLPMKIFEAIEGVFDGILNFVGNFIPNLLKAIPKIMMAVVSFVTELPAVFQEMLSSLPDIIMDILMELPTIIEDLVAGLVSNASLMAISLIEFLIKDSPKIAIALTKAMAITLPKAIIKGLLKGLQRIAQKIQSLFTGKKFKFPEIDVEGAVKKIGRALTGVGTQLFKISELGATAQAADKVKEFGKEINKAGLNVMAKLRETWLWVWGLLTGLWDGLTQIWRIVWGLLNGLWNGLTEIWRGIWAGLQSLWGILESIWKTVFKALEGLWKWLGGIWDVAVGALKKLMGGVGKIFKVAAEAIGGALSGAIDGLITFFTKTLPGAVKFAFKFVGEIFSVERIKEIFGKIGDLVGKIFDISKITDIFKKIFSALDPSNLLKKVFTIDGGGTGTIENLLGIDMPFVSFAEGNVGSFVGGNAKVPGDSKLNDTIPALLSPGEIVLPRSLSSNPVVLGFLKRIVEGETVRNFYSINQFKKDVGNAGGAVSGAVSGGLGSVADFIDNKAKGMEDLISQGGAVLSDGLKDVIASVGILLEDPIKGIQQQLELSFKRMVGGTLAREGLQDGGVISGFGGGDRLPFNLEAGEGILNKETVRRLGPGVINSLNQGGGFGDTSINVSLVVNTTQPVDERFIRSKIMPTVKSEFKRQSLDGVFLMSEKGIRR